jgi:hypothetical protein
LIFDKIPKKIERRKYTDIGQMVTELLKLMRFVESDSIWALKQWDNKRNRFMASMKSEKQAREILIQYCRGKMGEGKCFNFQRLSNSLFHLLSPLTFKVLSFLQGHKYQPSETLDPFSIIHFLDHIWKVLCDGRSISGDLFLNQVVKSSLNQISPVDYYQRLVME